ncbi:hypothetical protein GIX10_00145 [Acinetobacter sp. YIM 103518]|uniref:Uncharacterized protein n=1 Tax=Acinetobacter faecalis TaxID=2665161 RepID=A0A6L6GBK5_9GAMM|nr:hypothetical protein [Acinetobacter faecalis]MTD09866.1 hypothetical protein [Acinetobacter faecalis]
MNQTASHSQTPKFGNNKSQTTSILHREPTYEEMRGKSASIFSNICAFLLLSVLFFGLACMFIAQADKESAQQVEAMVQIAERGGR